MIKPNNNIKGLFEKNKMLCLLACFLAVLLFPALGTSAIQFTNNSYTDDGPQINNNGSVVWYGCDDNDCEIFLYNGSSTTQLTNPSYYDFDPQINNNASVVWYGWDGNDCNIFLYNGTSIIQLTDNSYIDYSPQINNNGSVVWYGCDDNDCEIFLYNGSSTTQLTNPSYYDLGPQINNTGHVVWYGFDDNDIEIFLYNGSNTVQLTDNSYNDYLGSYGRSRSINDSGSVVWEGYDGNDYEIFLHNGMSTVQLTDNPYDDVCPQINNNGYVVWYGYDDNDCEIFLYNGSSTTQLTDNSYNDYYPQINNNGYVVWEGYDGIEWKIYLYNGSSTIKIANNPDGFVYPQINDNGYIVWVGLDDEDYDYEIFGSITSPVPSDGCPDDPNKIDPGICGCGVPDTDTDSDGTPDCNDGCPADPNKIELGVCGCGVADTDSDSDGTPDCNDNCTSESNPDQSDIDNDNVGDVCDICTDTDDDGYGNPEYPANTCVLDNCPGAANTDQADGDGDGAGDVCDTCPGDPDNDADGDGVCGDIDNCPIEANPGQADGDLDGVGDVCDICPADVIDECNTEGSAAKEIDADQGGTVETPNGNLTIDVDPGDLNEDTTISVTEINPQDPVADLIIGPNAGLGQVVAAYDLRPDGIDFTPNKVTITIHADVTGLNENQRNRLGLYWRDESSEEFELVGGAVCSIVENPPGTFIKTCTAELGHFSLYAMVIQLDVSINYTGDYMLAIDETGSAAATMSAVLIDENEELIALSGAPVTFSVTDSSGNPYSECSTNTSALGEASCGIADLIPDVYTIKAMVGSGAPENPAALTEAILVVFDPNVPRATGGGFILPDAESTLPAESDKDKANFGFIVKIDKNKAAAGNLEFQYKAADINLKSQNMTWYTVSNNKAMFQGEATINGSGVYTFRVSAIDGDLTGDQPDAFDIKIWEWTDTEADPIHRAKNDLAGGNIVIHKK